MIAWVAMVRLLFALLLFALVGTVHAADPAKVLRIASPDIDTLDPQNFSDDPSFQIIQALFEPAKRGVNVRLGWSAAAMGEEFAARQPEEITCDEWKVLRRELSCQT